MFVACLTFFMILLASLALVQVQAMIIAGKQSKQRECISTVFCSFYIMFNEKPGEWAGIRKYKKLNKDAIKG